MRLFIHLLGGVGSLLAFLVAFGWLLIPSNGYTLVDSEAMQRFSFTLESVRIIGPTPWWLVGLASLSLGGVYLLLFNFSVMQTFFALLATGAIIIAIQLMTLPGLLLLFIVLSICCLGLLFYNKRQSNASAQH